uniref:Uncharacterized protein n=1 Tax=Sphaeramia orbicularis TaxID=375764 RepID=A0A673ADH1_9TELE
MKDIFREIILLNSTRNHLSLCFIEILIFTLLLLVDDACLGLCFEVHRAVKQGYFFLDETDQESMKEFGWCHNFWFVLDKERNSRTPKTKSHKAVPEVLQLNVAILLWRGHTCSSRARSVCS